jgi:predicted ATPase
MLLALSQDQGFQSWLGLGTALHGWALAMQGQGQEGIAQLRQGMAIWQGMGAEQILPFFLALLAEAYGKQGQTEDGLTVLNEALARVNHTGERFNETELYRLKGELTLQSQASLRQTPDKSQASLGEVSNESQTSQSNSKSPDTQHPTPSTQAEVEAEACFLKAIEIAQKQQAKSLELRAVMSLAHLLQQQGKRAEAHRLLAEIYNWFTEGFDTKDLQEAKALLEALGERAKRGNGGIDKG